MGIKVFIKIKLILIVTIHFQEIQKIPHKIMEI